MCGQRVVNVFIRREAGVLICVNAWFGTRGVGGSNPLAPTILSNVFRPLPAKFKTSWQSKLRIPNLAINPVWDKPCCKGDRISNVMSQGVIDSPGVRIPPPLIFVGGLIVGLSISAWFPTSYIGSFAAHTVGGTLVVLGVLLAASAIRIFVKSGTNLRPDRPSSALATGGPYRFTRNPMYLSLTVVYVGVAVFMQSLWSLLLLPFLLSFIQNKIIRREEDYLDRRFGDYYARYRSRVRRWL